MDQDVCLFSRARMELTGIEEGESFSETEITLVSSLGRISVLGADLKIGNFSAERGTLSLTGRVDGFSYWEEREIEGRRGIFAKLFR